LRTQLLTLSCAVLVLAGASPAPAVPPSQAPAGATTDEPEYRIGPGDVLHLFVWREADLTREITVRLDGVVTVPLLGDVAAGGRSPQELATQLREKLARYLEAPIVTVSVSQANSSRIYVVGMVNKPGVYPLTQPTTVLQALAVAGGFKEFARTGDIVVIRQAAAGSQTAIPVDYKKVEAGRDLAQNVALRSGDTVVVP
jgi:polysaccharide export outer membrane protein